MTYGYQRKTARLLFLIQEAYIRRKPLYPAMRLFRKKQKPLTPNQPDKPKEKAVKKKK
jgi:hypothetical protein